MKNVPLIFLPVFIDSCSTEISAQLNTGSISECLEGLTTKLYIAKSTQRFATLTLFKTKATWDAAIEAKDIVPLYNTYEVASANTEATKYESGNFVYTTKKEIKKMTSESYLSICSHRALKSFENSDYTQIYEVTEKGEILGVWDVDGVQVKGQDITNFDVAIRERPVNDKPPFTMCTITFRDFEEFEDYGIIVKPTWDPNVLNGVFEIQLQLTSASSTEVIFTALSACGASYYLDLLTADMVLADSGGASQTVVVSLLGNVYTATGTGLTTGTLATDGVIDKAGTLVEATAIPVIIV